MCGRYSLSSTAQLVRETFALADEVELSPRWNIAPTQESPVVRQAGEGRRLDLLRWGLVPEKAVTPAGHINARGETAPTLAAFRDSFRGKRCLVPADGFYEWLRVTGRPQPYHIRFRDRRLFAIAGLWSHWQRRGHATIDGFTILTCEPAAVVRPLHDRMPVILPASAWEEWLRADAEASALQELLVPWAGDELEAVAVSSFVNRADHEGPECVQPVTPEEATGGGQMSLFGPA
jgi:putative SOS response-associated peptidase YedK